MRRPRLLPDWKRVLRKAWSVKFNLISSVVGGVAAALPALAGLSGTTSHYVIVSLLWCVGLIAVFAPLAVAKYRRG